MLLAAALALTSVLHPGQPHPAQVKTHHYVTGGWKISIGHDVFTDAIVCSVKTSRMHYRNETVIFHIKTGIDTTHAYFKIDDDPARPVSDAFHEVQAHGFFPRRGWVDDPVGGDVALPAAYLRDANRVAIRAWRAPPDPAAAAQTPLDAERRRLGGCHLSDRPRSWW